MGSVPQISEETRMWTQGHYCVLITTRQQRTANEFF
jgi:hypothetical protein